MSLADVMNRAVLEYSIAEAAKHERIALDAAIELASEEGEHGACERRQPVAIWQKAPLGWKFSGVKLK